MNFALQRDDVTGCPPGNAAGQILPDSLPSIPFPKFSVLLKTLTAVGQTLEPSVHDKMTQ